MCLQFLRLTTLENEMVWFMHMIPVMLHGFNVNTLPL